MSAARTWSVPWPALVALAAVAAVAACGSSAASGTGGEDGKAPVPPRSKDVRDAAKLVELGQCDTAADKLNSYVGVHPDETEAYVVLGDALTCAAFAKGPNLLDAEKFEAARRAYGSALKLAPKDVRALVSAATLDLLAGRTADAKSGLEAARALEPGNRAAVNLLAVAVGLRDRAAVSSLLASVYAGRKRATVPPAIPGFCRPEAPPASWPHDVTVRVGRPGDCGPGVLLDSVEIDGNTYAGGSVFDSVKRSGRGVSFVDSVHPGRRAGHGWVVTGLQGGLTARAQRLEEARVVARRVPDLPSYGPLTGVGMDTANRAIASARAPWEGYASDANGFRRLEEALGVVDAVAPDSVKTAGTQVRVEAVNNAGVWYGDLRPRSVSFTFTFTPVSYEQFVPVEREVDERVMARLESLGEAIPALVIGMDFFSLDEKRALLFGRVFPGVPLLVAGAVLHLDPGQAVLSMKYGEVTLTFHGEGSDTLTFVDGELTELCLHEADELGARKMGTGP